MNVRDLEKMLKKAGWTQTEGGNHSIWSKEGRIVPVPRHKGDIKKGTAESILKQADLKK